MRKFINIGFWIILAAFLIRVFAFQSYKVDSFSMASTLIPGDRVLVNKIKTGSRFPSSIIGLPGPQRAYLDLFRIPYFRLPGFRDFKRSDIVVYNDPRISDKPYDRSFLKISRLVGLPGDTVIILDKELYINRNKINDPETFRHLYRVIIGEQPVPYEFLSEYKIEEPRLIADIGIYDYGLDSTSHLAIQEYSTVKTIRLRKQFIGDSSKEYFPFSSFFLWNRDQFGPLVVPFEGQEVDLTLKNVDLYREIIDIYEANDLLVDFSGITINGRKADSYIFKRDYFFVLDDNQANPADSRIIGFIPESHLLGTSKRILSSGKSQFKYLGKFRLKRLFKKLD